ncbi:hypothetical protein [Sphingomonas immobilis]|uniref:hypothetical protein n=1 Tax=Sphingomonas immobilis TaxID=3063997 RepID=UPI00272AC6F1|nr:hypothetical protein [Sphingomonas sp. CA1-15]
MTCGPEDDEPGFETDVDERDHRNDNGSERTLEEAPAPDSPDQGEIEHAREDPVETR